MRKTILIAFILTTLMAHAQVGSHRNDFSIGINGGYIFSDVGFNPKVPQKMHGGITGGLTFKYVCEKYFKTICSLLAEINYASIGWKEDIVDVMDQPVINPVTGIAEEYSRTINYIQIPVFAHLAWGKETNGAQFFFHVGPQMGIYLNESTKTNFDFKDRNIADRANTIVAQDTMRKAGRYIIEARYYYGLGNIYGDSKRDYFGKSNFGNIVLKFTYLFDLVRTKSKTNNI